MSSKRKRSNYAAAFKLKVVAFAETSNNCAAGREFDVSEKMVRDWKKAKSTLAQLPKNKKACRHSVTPYLPLETLLSEWVTGLRQTGHIVTRGMIQKRALYIHKSEDLDVPDNFRASAGWCSHFLRRNNLLRRQRTPIAEKLPAEKKVQQQVPRKVVLDSDQAVECELCGERFGNNQSLGDHIMKLHALRFVWKCMLCSAKLPNLFELMKHISVHLGREANCSCGSYSNFVKLAGDLAQDCHFCGESFLLFCDLDKHYRKHAGEECWHCNECRQIFSSLVDLKAHYYRAMHPTARGKSVKAQNRKSVRRSHRIGLLRRPIHGEKENLNHVNDLDMDMNCSVADRQKTPSLNPPKTMTNLLDNPLFTTQGRQITGRQFTDNGQ